MFLEVFSDVFVVFGVLFLVRDISGMLSPPFVYDGSRELCVLSNHSFGILVLKYFWAVLLVPVGRFVRSLVGLDAFSSKDSRILDVLVCHVNDSLHNFWVCLYCVVSFCTLPVVVFACYWTSHSIDGEPLLAS